MPNSPAQLMQLGDWKVYWSQGSKSQNDFLIWCESPQVARFAPRHIYWVEDLRQKHQGNASLTSSLVGQIIQIANAAKGISSLPPSFSQFHFSNTKVIKQHKPLNRYGRFSVEILLALTELLFIQEVTNYPNGILHKLLSRMLYDELQGKSLIPGHNLKDDVTVIARWQPSNAAQNLRKIWGRAYQLL